MSHLGIIPKSIPSRAGFIQRAAGASLGMALVLTSAVLVLAIAIFDFTQQSTRLSSRRVNEQAAIRLAEAGIEKTVWCLNNPTNTTDCPGNPTVYVGESSVSVGNGTFTTSWDSGSRTVTSTGNVSGSGGPTSKTLKTVLSRSGAEVAFQYGLQVGTGGITMSNSSQIIGNVFANGSVTGYNTATITGDVILAVGDATTNVGVDPSPNTTTIFGRTSPNTRYVAQSFVPTITDSVYEIDLKVARTATAPSAINVKLYTHDAANDRPGSQLATKSVAGSVFPVNIAGWDNGWTEVSISPTALTAGTKYWIVLEVSTTNNSNYYFVLHSTGDPYTSNTARIGSSLTSLSQLGSAGSDIAFAVKMGGTFPVLAMNGGVGGSVKAHTIGDTNVTPTVNVGNHAYYQALNGTVRANTSGTPETCTTTPGTYCHPNTPEETPAQFPLTSAQINQLELGAGSTTVGTQTFISGNTNLGPVVINGDLYISNTAIVTLTGTIWVKGNIVMSNSGKIVLSDSYGTDSGVIIAHDPSNPTSKGKIYVSNSAQILGNSNPDTFILAIAMSNDLSSSVVGLSNSQVGSIYYAPNGLVSVSNSASMKELVAKKITTANSATITYDQGLVNEFFSSGPGGSWAYQKGTYQIL